MAAPASDWLRHFRLLLCKRWTEFNKTWQEARSQRPLPSLCFSGRSEKKMAAPSSDWLRHFRLLFFGLPWPLICWYILNFSSETTEWNSMKLDRKQGPNVLFQDCIFRANQETKMAVLANLSNRWHMVLRCTICGPLGLLLTFRKWWHVFYRFSFRWICQIIICLVTLLSLSTSPLPTSLMTM